MQNDLKRTTHTHSPFLVYSRNKIYAHNILAHAGGGGGGGGVDIIIYSVFKVKRKAFYSPNTVYCETLCRSFVVVCVVLFSYIPVAF